MNKVEEVENSLEACLELFLNIVKEEANELPSMTIFFDSSYNTYSIFPYENESQKDFMERVRGLEKDIYPIIILGCDPVKHKFYDNVIAIVHTETNIDRKFYHKKNYRIDDGWEEAFE